jgi:hypothetical protein
MVCNPSNNEDAPYISNESEEEIEIPGGSVNSIGTMLLIKSEIMKNDPQESKLCYWATLFYDKMQSYVNDNIKFFELRPFAYGSST